MRDKKAYQAAYYLAHREQWKDYSKEWRKKNREKLKTYNREYRKSNRARVKARDARGERSLRRRVMERISERWGDKIPRCRIDLTPSTIVSDLPCRGNLVIDAECYLSVSPKGTSVHPFLGCGTTSKEQVEKLRRIVGKGSLNGPIFAPSKPMHWKPIYQYRLTSNGLRWLLPQIRLTTKEPQRVLLLEALSLVDEPRAKQRGNGKPPPSENVKRRNLQIITRIHELNKTGIL